MEKSVYLLNSYNLVLKLKIGRFSEKWGLISKMAEAAQCQRSHLSRVLQGKAQLTLEQAMGLCEFFEMSEAESDYFLLLVEKERAGSASLRKRFEKKIQSIRAAQEDIAHRVQKKSLGVDEQELTYYSSWYWIAIHIIVSIPQYQTPAAIAKRLSIDEEQVKDCLATMASFGLIKKENNRWIFSSSSIHLPKNSPLISIHHANWRYRSVISSQKKNTEDLHYTVIQSLSHDDFRRVKHILLQTIDDIAKVAGPSKEEELIYFCCDFARV